MTEHDFEALADEAERGYEIDQDPTLPEVWAAELMDSEGHVVARMLLVDREMADQALAAHWRIVRYVRADLA